MNDHFVPILQPIIYISFAIPLNLMKWWFFWKIEKNIF